MGKPRETGSGIFFDSSLTADSSSLLGSSTCSQLAFVLGQHSPWDKTSLPCPTVRPPHCGNTKQVHFHTWPLLDQVAQNPRLEPGIRQPFNSRQSLGSFESSSCLVVASRSAAVCEHD